MYKFAPLSQIIAAMPEIEARKVSPIARSSGQFLDQYKEHGKNLPEFWQRKRFSFISRMRAAQKINPTRRRKLALLVWAYKM
jgi:hypothetical protein